MDRESGGAPSDREQRNELERLQLELREARERLARGTSPRAVEVADLELQLAQERMALAKIASGNATLEAEGAALEERNRMLVTQIKDARASPLGKLRLKQRKGLSQQGDHMSVVVIPVVIFAALALFFIYFWGFH